MTTQSAWIQSPLLLASVFVLERSANAFLDNVSALSQRLQVDEALIALLTAGAEWEELAVVVSSIIAGRHDLAYSNVIGSCIANILGGLGLGMMFLPSTFEYDSSTRLYTGAQLLVTLMTTLILLNTKRLDARLCATLCFAIFTFYVIITLRLIWSGKMDAPEDSDSDSDSDAGNDNDTSISPDTVPDNETSALLTGPSRRGRKGLARLIFMMLLSASIMSLASYLITSSLVILTRKLGLTESTAGLTILSFITTLPEKFFAVIAGRRAQGGVIVAGTAGSNIFLLTLCLGVIFSSVAADSLLVRPQELLIVLICSLVLTGMVFLLPGYKRQAGSVLLISYGAFLVYEISANVN